MKKKSLFHLDHKKAVLWPSLKNPLRKKKIKKKHPCFLHRTQKSKSFLSKDFNLLFQVKIESNSKASKNWILSTAKHLFLQIKISATRKKKKKLKSVGIAVLSKKVAVLRSMLTAFLKRKKRL